MFNEGPMLLASEPILTSNKQGPPRGALIQCSEMQGYLFSKPLTSFDLESLMAEWHLSKLTIQSA
jgi:sensor domain CHASE-containing protein